MSLRTSQIAAATGLQISHHQCDAHHAGMGRMGELLCPLCPFRGARHVTLPVSVDAPGRLETAPVGHPQSGLSPPVEARSHRCVAVQVDGHLVVRRPVGPVLPRHHRRVPPCAARPHPQRWGIAGGPRPHHGLRPVLRAPRAGRLRLRDAAHPSTVGRRRAGQTVGSDTRPSTPRASAVFAPSVWKATPWIPDRSTAAASSSTTATTGASARPDASTPG